MTLVKKIFKINLKIYKVKQVNKIIQSNIKVI